MSDGTFDGLVFYRCELCRGIISPWDLKKNEGCQKCGQRRVRLSNLTLFEKLVQLCKHPKFWEWKNV
jgi:hypothetical protein